MGIISGTKRVLGGTSRYVVRTLLGLDQFANTLLGGAPDETISARAGRNRSKKGWRVLAWALNRIDPGHVEDAIRSERVGSQQDPAYEDVFDPDDYIVVTDQVQDPNHAR